MRVLGLIPARGGSKGVPRKNVRVLGGKPLLQWTVEAALGSHTLAKVVVSTEEQEIADLARTCGAAVPFLRPIELSADDTPALPVVQHAVQSLEKLGDRFDAICLLQPTNPFRSSSDIDACVELLASSDADTVMSILGVPSEYNPHWVYFRSSDGTLSLSTGEAEPIPRRQVLPPAFHREGSVYVTRRDVIMLHNSLYGPRVIGYELSAADCVNIDTLADWHRAENMIRELVS